MRSRKAFDPTLVVVTVFVTLLLAACGKMAAPLPAVEFHLLEARISDIQTAIMAKQLTTELPRRNWSAAMA